MIGAAFALFLWVFFDTILAFLGASPEMLPDCRAYLGVLLPFFPIAAVSLLFDTFCIAAGRARPGFLGAPAGDIRTVPGLPKRPAAESIDVDETGKIIGLF